MKLFIAQTIDGYIAGPGHSLDHLTPFQSNDYGYAAHLETVDAVVLGRRTFDLIVPKHGWTYPCRLSGVVLTSQALPPGLPRHVQAMAEPKSVAELYPNAFVDGGARTIQAFLDIDAIDVATIFTLPVVLGDGVRLFAGSGTATGNWSLMESRRYPCGTVGNRYRITAARPAARLGAAKGQPGQPRQ